MIHHGGAGTGPKPLDNEHKGWSMADVLDKEIVDALSNDI